MTKPVSQVIILGHRGFIGSYLYAQFKQNPEFETFGFSSKNYDLLDLEAAKQLSRKFNSQTILIFCAAIGRSQRDDEESFLKNITMASNLALILKKCQLQHCIFLSSIDVYGKPPTRKSLDEKTVPVPDGYYGWSKYAGEFLMQKAMEGKKSILTILRLSGIYGCSKVGFSPINIWMRDALHKGRISLFGDGSERRDYVWLEDLYPLICRLIDSKAGGIFNVATGQSYSLLDIINKLRKLVSKPVEIVCAERKREWLDYQLDTTALREVVRPFSMTPLAEGLKRLYDNNAPHS